MVKQIKKGTVGERAQYITKGKAMRQLQLDAKQFHRLCILKGVYPREPRKKRASNKTYYHIKDIRFLGHEQLLRKFRQIDAWMKKIRKARNRGDLSKAQKLIEITPKYSLHHLVKERYPTFVSALQDLDDALSLICLFASCPSNKDLRISVDMIQMSERLWHEFEIWIMTTRSIRKAFLSIKGIYYTAEVKGQEVTWLVPYQFSQNLPLDVDYSIMMTFLEFYHTLMRFVNFKLFQEIGLAYPPDLTSSIESFTQNPVIPPDIEIPQEFSSTPEMQEWRKKLEERKISQQLFAGKVFLLGRETPRYSLGLVIRGCSGELVEEDSPYVTHQIVDRPVVQMQPGREYVQPQWVYDCLNFKILLPIQPYHPGNQLPPHLSPYVDVKELSYVPERYREIMQLKGIDLEEQAQVEEERKELGKIMMSKKIRNLYNRMQLTLRKKKKIADGLKQKRAEIEEV